MVIVQAGSAYETTVSSGGTQDVLNGIAVNAHVMSGGTQILNGGSSYYATFWGNDIVSAGVEYTPTISSGGTVTILAGGYNSLAEIYASGQLLVSGGAGNGTNVFSGGMETLVSGGAESNTTIFAGGLETVSNGGITSATTISGGTLQVMAGGSVRNGVTFADAGGVLEVADVASLSATISGFALGDAITLTSAAFDPAGTVTFDNATDMMTVTEGGTSYTLDFAGDYTEKSFQLSRDANGGTDITLCFYAGTHIATPAGNVAVEDLAAGDLVLTANGAAQPVIWLGRSTVFTRFADSEASSPIRIKAGALGEGLPVRDLLVSPNHALFLDGILVQANALVNGMSIVRETNLPEFFTYFHVELATHELLISEGVPSESFVDNVDRMNFENWNEHEALSCNKTGIEEMPYPRAKAARQIPSALCERLAERAARISAMPLCA